MQSEELIERVLAFVPAIYLMENVCILIQNQEFGG